MEAFPLIVQGGAPIYSYLALCLCTVGAQIVLVSRRGPLGRSEVGKLDPGNLLAQGIILAISLSGVSPGACPILAQSGRRDLSVDRSGVSFGLVRRSLGFLSAGLSYVALSPNSAPGEGSSQFLNLQIDCLGPQTYSSGVSWSPNLFGHVISVSKLKNHPIRFSNLFTCVIPVSKLDFESHLGKNRLI